jgi:hypothetical protein
MHPDKATRSLDDAFPRSGTRWTGRCAAAEALNRRASLTWPIATHFGTLPTTGQFGGAGIRAARPRGDGAVNAGNRSGTPLQAESEGELAGEDRIEFGDLDELRQIYVHCHKK